MPRRPKRKLGPLDRRNQWLQENPWNDKDNPWGCNRMVRHKHKYQLATLDWELVAYKGVPAEQGDPIPVAPLDGFGRGAHTRVAGGLYEFVPVGEPIRIVLPRRPRARRSMATAQARSAFASHEAMKNFIKITRKRGQKEVKVGYVDDGPRR